MSADEERYQRRRDPSDDPAFVSRPEIEVLCNQAFFDMFEKRRGEIERIVDQKSARFLSKEEILDHIDKRASQRWRNMGVATSVDPYAPGQPEEDGRKLFDYLRVLQKDSLEEGNRIVKSLQIIVPIMTAIGLFVGGCYWLFTHISMHVS